MIVSWELRLFAADFHLCNILVYENRLAGEDATRFHIAIDDHNESAVFWGSLP